MNKKEIEKEEMDQISGGSMENLKPIRIKYRPEKHETPGTEWVKNIFATVNSVDESGDEELQRRRKF
jgi:hypothetical protein